MKKRGKEVTGVIYITNEPSKGAIGTLKTAYCPINACVCAIENADNSYGGNVWMNGLTGVVQISANITQTAIFSFYYLTA